MADFNAVVDEYKVIYLNVRETVRLRVEVIHEELIKLLILAQKAGEYGKNLYDVAELFFFDISSVGKDGPFLRYAMENYLWVSSCMLIARMGQIVGRRALYQVLHCIFSPHVACLLALVLIPLYSRLALRKMDISEDNKRMILFAYNLASEIFLGFATKFMRLNFTPPAAFLAPLAIGIIPKLLHEAIRTMNRLIFYAVCTGPVFMVYILYAYLIGNFCFAYFIWSLVLCFTTILDYQMKLGQRKKTGFGFSSDYVITINSYAVTYYLMHWLFSALLSLPMYVHN